MLEKIHGIPNRIAALQAKLKAREGKAEFKENCKAIKAEIARLETASLTTASLAEFIESEQPVASQGPTG